MPGSRSHLFFRNTQVFLRAKRKPPAGRAYVLRKVLRHDRVGAPTTQQPTRPPVRAREWVSEEANLGFVSCWIRRRSRATSCQEWAMG